MQVDSSLIILLRWDRVNREMGFSPTLTGLCVFTDKTKRWNPMMCMFPCMANILWVGEYTIAFCGVRQNVIVQTSQVACKGSGALLLVTGQQSNLPGRKGGHPFRRSSFVLMEFSGSHALSPTLFSFYFNQPRINQQLSLGTVLTPWSVWKFVGFLVF